MKKLLTKGECISVDAYVEGGEGKARKWLKTEGAKNIQKLNSVLEKTVTPWSNLFDVIAEESQYDRV